MKAGVSAYLSKQRSNLLDFTRSYDFAKAIILSLAIGLPILAGIKLGYLEESIAIAVGCLLSSPSDIPGNLKHKSVGVLLAAFLAGFISLLMGYAQQNIWILLLSIPGLMFGISYLAVFGFRASLVAFSGLFAIVLSFANLSGEIEIWERAIFITTGGLWYLSLSTAYYFLNPKKITEEFLADCLRLTARFMEKRAQMLNPDCDKESITKEVLQLQTQLSEKHEDLRGVLIRSRLQSGSSNYVRKRLLIFIELVDIFELALANPFIYEKTAVEIQKDNKRLEEFQEYIRELSGLLHQIAEEILSGKKDNLKSLQNKITAFLDHFKTGRQLANTGLQSDSNFYIFQLYNYLEKQTNRILTILRIFGNLGAGQQFLISREAAARFITPQDYDPKILLENFNLKSPIFRHSLRLALVVLVGFGIGLYFSIDNAYWIILTIVVIMRPNYGLTRERSWQRIVGTIIGAIIALGIVFLSQNPILYGVLGWLSLTFAFSLIQRNYKTAAIFVTLSIVFIYSLLQPNVYEVIKFRVVDTLLGAGLAALGNQFLWPFWETSGIENLIRNSVRANRKFLAEINDYYKNKTRLPASYKLARKEAFLAMGQLNAAFQRMTQEPRARQQNLKEIYEITNLNQTFLSVLAAMGTFMRNHPTTAASKEFEVFVNHIQQELTRTIEETKIDSGERSNLKDLDKARKNLDTRLKSLLIHRDREIQKGKFSENKKMREELQEARMLIDHLKWLLEIAEKLEKRYLKLMAN